MVVRSDVHDRWKNCSVHSNTGKGRRITLAAATTKEMWAAINERRARQMSICLPYRATHARAISEATTALGQTMKTW